MHIQMANSLTFNFLLQALHFKSEPGCGEHSLLPRLLKNMGIYVYV